VITHILSKARPEDSFALLTTRGPRVELRFGSSREAIRAAAEQLESTPQGKSGKGGVLDAVLEATTWFQPPQPGDSIFLMTLHLEGKHRASFSKVRAAVAAGRIRVFGFQLGEQLLRITDAINTAAESLEMQVFGQYSILNQTLLLSRDSGGEATLENTQEGKQYKLTGDRLRLLHGTGEAMYMEATDLYLLQLERTGPDVVIALAPPVLEQLPWASVVYPKSLPPCSGPATPAPAHTETPR
jgi:hypothetical protein